MFAAYLHNHNAEDSSRPRTNEHAIVGRDATEFHAQQRTNFAATDLSCEITKTCGGDALDTQSWVNFSVAARSKCFGAPLPRRLPQSLVAKFAGRSRTMAIRYNTAGDQLAVGHQLGGVAVVTTPSAHSGDRLTVTAQDHASELGWSLLDVSWHDSGTYLVRSGWSGTIAVLKMPTHEGGDCQTQLFDAKRLSDNPMGIFSVAMMGDTVVAATNVGMVFAADLNSEQVRFRAHNHALDVNAVCSVSALHGVFASGGDDGVVNITDLRARRAASCFGHSHGITALDSRGDERYIVSNCKDQTAKIFDLRKAVTDVATIRHGMQQTHRALNTIDYRAGPQLTTTFVNTRADNSELTLTGHQVYYTLLRCRFSPLASTGGRYVACGAIDGRVAIFDILSGELRTLGDRRYDEIIRDVSWHPSGTHIAAACIDGGVRIFGPQPQDDEREATVYARNTVVPARLARESSDSQLSSTGSGTSATGSTTGSSATTYEEDGDDDDVFNTWM